MKTEMREPAVAGMFYPAGREALERTVRALLRESGAVPDEVPPKALIVPHAGYVYSGPVAARVYGRLRPGVFSRVVAAGPAHHVPVRGAAGSSAERWRTPLGEVPCERPAAVAVNDAAHAAEHSLEVQLPFLQTVLGAFTLVPLVFGAASADEAAAVLEAVWGGSETLVVISTDLSHYESYRVAQAMDRRAADAILALDDRALEEDNACGLSPLRGLLRAARRRKLRVELADLRNSGDTAGSRDQVVGYGAFAFYG